MAGLRRPLGVFVLAMNRYVLLILTAALFGAAQAREKIPPAAEFIFPLPPSRCDRPRVTIDTRGDIYKNNVKLGKQAKSFKAACFGDVAWVDGHSSIFKNYEMLGSSASSFVIGAYSGVVVWVDAFGAIYRDHAYLGSGAEIFEAVSRTGDAVWIDKSQNLYRNDKRIGTDVVDYEVASDGRIQWESSAGRWYSSF